MLGTRWHLIGNCSSDLDRLQSELERAFGQLTGKEPRKFSQATYPALNVWETDEVLHVEAELPGFELDQLEIYVSDEDVLTIEGQRKEPELEDATWHHQERGFGCFERGISLPHDVDPDQVTAEFKNGVLTVSLPKKDEAQPRRIKVKAS